VDTLVVAVDPGKALNRVWLSTDAGGLLLDPLTLPVLRSGIDELTRLIQLHRGGLDPVIAIETTGALHQAWAAELSQRFPDSVRLFAPSETVAARAQLGSRRFKTDDRDCAALTYLARQGHGRHLGADEHELLTAVRFRRGLLAERKAAQPRSRPHRCRRAGVPGLPDRPRGSTGERPVTPGPGRRSAHHQRRDVLERTLEGVPASTF
jgi:hypothetical protein